MYYLLIAYVLMLALDDRSKQVTFSTCKHQLNMCKYLCVEKKEFDEPILLRPFTFWLCNFFRIF